MSDQSYLMGKKRFFLVWRIGDYISISSSKYKFFSVIFLNHHQNIKKAVKDASWLSSGSTTWWILPAHYFQRNVRNRISISAERNKISFILIDYILYKLFLELFLMKNSLRGKDLSPYYVEPDQPCRGRKEGEYKKRRYVGSLQNRENWKLTIVVSRWSLCMNNCWKSLRGIYII